MSIEVFSHLEPMEVSNHCTSVQLRFLSLCSSNESMFWMILSWDFNSSRCSHIWEQWRYQTIVQMLVLSFWADIARTSLCFRGPFRDLSCCRFEVVSNHCTDVELTLLSLYSSNDPCFGSDLSWDFNSSSYCHTWEQWRYQTIVQVFNSGSWAYVARTSLCFGWFWVEISTLRGVLTFGNNGDIKPLYKC
jgi:hypothetical protein